MSFQGKRTYRKKGQNLSRHAGASLELIVSGGRKFSKSKSEILRSLQIRSISHRRENTRVQTSCRSCSKSANKNSIYHVPSGKEHHRRMTSKTRTNVQCRQICISPLDCHPSTRHIHTNTHTHSTCVYLHDSTVCNVVNILYPLSRLTPPSNPTQLRTFFES